MMRTESILLFLIMSICLVAWKPGTIALAAEAPYTLYGTSELGWGFTNQTMTTPGPDLSAKQGEMVRITLTAAIEPSFNVTFPHDFGVDYDGDCQPLVQTCFPSPGEPWSGYFGGGSPNGDTLEYAFTPDATPGTYKYYCYVHPTTMFGNFTIAESRPPVASFSYAPASPAIGETVTFDASDSSDPDGNITSYTWLFGDGNSGSGVFVQHDYLNPGNYTASLTVRDDVGLTDTTSQSVNVTGPGNSAPVANFTFTPSAPILGQRVDFNASSSQDSDPGDQVVSYSWTFGDGTILTGQTLPQASHVYRTFGTLQVTLNVTDSHGLMGQSSPKQIGILPVRNVAVTRLEVKPVSVRLGAQVSINLTVSNLGNVTEVFGIELMGNSTQIAKWSATLAAADQLDRPFNWIPPSSGAYTVSAKVLVSPDDQTELDNEKKVSMTVEVQDGGAGGLPGLFYWSVAGAGVAAFGLAVYIYSKRRVQPRAATQPR